MKKRITLLLFLIPGGLFAQIEIKPATTQVIGGTASSIYSNNKSMSIGPSSVDLSLEVDDEAGLNRLGIGTVFYGGLLHGPEFINDGKLHIRHMANPALGSSSAGPHLILDQHTENGNAILRFRNSWTTDLVGPFANKSYSSSPRYWDIRANSNDNIYANDVLSFVNGDGTSNREVLFLKGDGEVGILTNNPRAIFHINTSQTTISGVSGAQMIGLVSEKHLTFDSDEINAYSNEHTGQALILNDDSEGDVKIGDTTPSDLVVSGFTQLGTSSAPKIKMKKLTGTMGAGSTMSIAHGLNVSKILDVKMLIYEAAIGAYFSSDFRAADVYFSYYQIGGYVRVSSYAPAFYNESYKILITYEE